MTAEVDPGAMIGKYFELSKWFFVAVFLFRRVFWHMLCMVHIMYQNTLPNKNIAMKNHLDSSKYFPIMASGSTSAVMRCYSNSLQERLSAHAELLLDQSYDHCRLDDLFRVDTY